MLQTPRIPVARRRAAVAVLATSLALAAPLFAQNAARPQTPAQTTPPAQAAPTAPAGPTLSLTMDQAVTMALETNLGLMENRLNLAIASQAIASARAAFLPTLTGALSRNSRTSVPQNQFETNASITTSSSLQGSSRWAQALPFHGASYSVSWASGRTATNAFSTFNPTLTSQLSLNFTQPLWQRFAIDANQVGVTTAEKNREITDLTLQQTILQTQDQVRQAYLSLIAARESLSVARQNQALNEAAYQNALSRIRYGAAAEIDAVQSKASELSSEDQVIQAEAGLASAEDALRTLVVDTSRPDFWQVHIEATDPMDSAPTHVDADAVLRNALANRLDLVVARRALDVTRLNLKLSENLTKPSVDFSANYAAQGTGGIEQLSNNGVPVTVVTGFGTVFGNSFSNTNPSWTFGISAAYPIGRTAAKVALTRGQIQEEQQQIDLKNQEVAVAAQVRNAVRQVESNYKRVLSNQAALDANVQQYDAEQRKMAVGMSTTFDVLQKQQLLAAARVAKLSADIAYNQSLLQLDRVQKIR